MRQFTTHAIIVVVLAGAFSSGLGQTATDPAATNAVSPTALPEGWEEIDERFMFLTVRLSGVEASLEVVNKAIRVTGYRQTVRKSDADQYRKGNERMDRNAGGPVRWDEFYGRSAEKFFYHPTDRNTTYRTTTILTQKAPTGDQAPGTVAPSQGVPIHQRPPQFDYIYRANVEAQKRAIQEAAALGGNIDGLLQRRRQLESEQSALWCLIASQAIGSRDLSNMPMYSSELKAGESDAATRERLEAARAACEFVRAMDRLMSDVQQSVEANQGAVFEQLPVVVAKARKTLVSQLGKQKSVAQDVRNPQTAIGKVSACAKRMDDLSKNVLDSYRLALASDQAGDDRRKDALRGLLQDNLMSCAETVLTLDQCVTEMAEAWNLSPGGNESVAAPTARLPVIAPAQASPAAASAPSVATTTPAKPTTPAPTAARSSQDDGWFVLFRSADPSIWDTDTNNGPDCYAVPLAKAPENTRYVRVAKADGDCIIIPILKQQLGRTNQKPWGRTQFIWKGSTGLDTKHGAYHIGIYQLHEDRPRKGSGKAGCVTIHPSICLQSAWGFGHGGTRAAENSGPTYNQAYGWGDEQLGPTVFEISVKATPLTEAEKQHLKE